ncbi:MAG: hypothetical protein CMD53_02055 [Gammaproteobacteria bacterium]|nr:hypothetical protein [Gammaproteobacteria bacterium]
MKQSLKQKQKLSLSLTVNLQNQIKLLSLSGFEIRSKLEDLILEFCNDKEDKKIAFFQDELLIDKYKNIINSQAGNNLAEIPIDSSINLKEKLIEQLMISNLKDFEMLIGEYLIDSIQENGRLEPEIDFQDITKIVEEDFNLTISTKEIEKVLKEIQHFDPPGCGYRSIFESLKVQINCLDISQEEGIELNHALKLLLEEKVALEDLDQKTRRNIKILNFDPGLNFGSNNESYIRPDLIALYENRNWHVSLNDNFMPKELIQRIRDKIGSEKIDKNHEAKSFLRGLERRQQTLLVVAQYIVSIQSDFLSKESSKRPLSIKEIAKSLQISESTVSRIVNNKYIQFPDKLILLKNILQKRVNIYAKGEDVTPKQLIRYIGDLISEEDKKRPLSDELIKNCLSKDYSIFLARRTVTKYRIESGYESSRIRKV